MDEHCRDREQQARDRGFDLAGRITPGTTVRMPHARTARAVATAVTLLVGVALLGLSQLVFVIANQSLVGSWSGFESYDQQCSGLSLVTSFGQVIGPASAGVIAGVRCRRAATVRDSRCSSARRCRCLPCR